MTASGSKQLESLHHAHFSCLNQKLKPSSRKNEDFCNGFHRDAGQRIHKISRDKENDEKNRTIILCKEFYRLSEHHEKATVGPE